MRGARTRTTHPDVVLAALLAAGLVIALLQTFVAPAVPAIADAYGTSPESASWVLTAFLLSSSVSTPLAGKLGDLYGRSRVMVVVLVLFAVGSVVCWVAGDFGWLVAGRVVQGLGGGVFPLAYGILRQVMPPHRVPGAIGLFVGLFGIGGTVGLAGSGLVIDELGIDALFWVGVLAVPAAAVIAWLVPDQPRRAGVRLDWWGAALLSVLLGSLLLGLSQGGTAGWGSPLVVGLLGLAAVATVAWLVVERRVEQPMVDLQLLRHRPVLAADLASFAVGFSMFSFFLLVPLILQARPGTGADSAGFGLSVTVTGLIMLPSAIVQLALAPFAGVLGRRISSRFPLLLGSLAVAAAYAILVADRSSTWIFVLSGTVLGIGLAFSVAATSNVVVEAVPAHQVGVSTAINQIARTVGAALGTQVVTAVLAISAASGSGPTGTGYTVAFAVCAFVAIIAFVVGLAIPVRRAGTPEHVADQTPT